MPAKNVSTPPQPLQDAATDHSRYSILFCSTCGEGLPMDAGFCVTCGRRQKVLESPARPTVLLAETNRRRIPDRSDRSSIAARTTLILFDLLPPSSRGLAVRTTQKLLDVLPKPSKALDVLFATLITLGVIIVILQMILL